VKAHLPADIPWPRIVNEKWKRSFVDTSFLLATSSSMDLENVVNRTNVDLVTSTELSEKQYIPVTQHDESGVFPFKGCLYSSVSFNKPFY
jgi:hypothetical protein